MLLCDVGVGWSAWRGMSWLQSLISQSRRSCENGPFLLLWNSSTVEKETLVFMFLGKPRNSQDLLRVTFQLSHLGKKHDFRKQEKC